MTEKQFKAKVRGLFHCPCRIIETDARGRKLFLVLQARRWGQWAAHAPGKEPHAINKLFMAETTVARGGSWEELWESARQYHAVGGRAPPAGYRRESALS